MGSMYKGVFQGRWLPQLSFIRNKHKHNITKPRLPHFERHVVEHVCTPYFAQKKRPQHLPDINACTTDTVESTNYMSSQLMDILAKEALDKIRNAKFIGFYHLNSRAADDIFEFQLLLKKNKMKYTTYNNKVLIKGLTGTEYEPVCQLFQGPTAMAICEEFQLQKLLKLSKKLRKITLMAALYENRLLSLSELKHYGQYESLDAARVNLVHTLNSPSQNLSQQINHHPNTLVWSLDENVKNLKKGDPGS